MKKSIAWVLVLVLVSGLLTGCGKKEGNTDQAAPEETENQQEATATRDFFPLAEKKELSIWYYFDNDYVTDPNDLYAIQWLEEQTNVHITFQTVTPQEASEKFGLMLASGDYPDILRACNGYYPGGLQKAVREGVAVDLTDLIPKYMPNYQRIRTSDPILERDTKTDDGKLVSIWSVASNRTTPQGEMMWMGIAVRRDWLEELNLPIPVTIADWDTTLRAFKEQYQCEAPLMIPPNGLYSTGSFLTAFGVFPAWYQVDGKVLYGPMQDGYKEYLELMAGWYADGLIDPNFVTNNATVVPPAEYMGTGRAGASENIWNFAADTYKTYGYTQEEDFYLQAVTNPVMNEGDMPENSFITASSLAKEAHVITTNCEDVELALRWMDMWYEEDVMMTTSYGKEGETYVINEDGSVSFTDLIMKDPEYTPQDALKVKWTPGTSNMGLFNWGYFEPLYSNSESFQAEYIWAENSMEKALSNSISMTDEESAEYNSMYTDIKTLVDETTVKYIMGTESLDTFETFREGLRTYGVEHCAELWQAAYERYLAR